MDDQVYIIHITGEHTGRRQWFVHKGWAEDAFYDAKHNVKPGQKIELIQMDMDFLIDYALDEVLAGGFMDEDVTDFQILESHEA